jgi:DNA adenine methylase
MIAMPQPIPYQGSKRNLAKFILPYFPANLRNLYEPFAGSAAITVAAAYQRKAQHFFINDFNTPLMDLWDWIIHRPNELMEGYTRLWNEQLSDPKIFYPIVRARFNASHHPVDFLYLLARGVKGSIRYNTNGEYNQSPDNRRLGKQPETMRAEVERISSWLRGKVTITALDFRQATLSAAPGDLVYMDPPYQGVCTGRDNRYLAGVQYSEMVAYLQDLNQRNIPWILSYDGSTGEKKYGKDLPLELGAHHLYVNAGKSSQATLNGEDAETIESVYLSRGLVMNLNLTNNEIEARIQREIQPSLWNIQ